VLAQKGRYARIARQLPDVLLSQPDPEHERSAPDLPQSRIETAPENQNIQISKKEILRLKIV
jgi:hypothetical protein